MIYTTSDKMPTLIFKKFNLSDRKLRINPKFILLYRLLKKKHFCSKEEDSTRKFGIMYQIVVIIAEYVKSKRVGRFSPLNTGESSFSNMNFHNFQTTGLGRVPKRPLWTFYLYLDNFS